MKRANARLDALERAAAEHGTSEPPLTAGVREHGKDGETRPPGVYWYAGFRPESRTPVVVKPPGGKLTDEFLQQCFPGARRWPLLIGGDVDVTNLWGEVLTPVAG